MTSIIKIITICLIGIGLYGCSVYSGGSTGSGVPINNYTTPRVFNGPVFQHNRGPNSHINSGASTFYPRTGYRGPHVNVVNSGGPHVNVVNPSAHVNVVTPNDLRSY